MHIVFLMSNNSYCPYFRWFAAKSAKNPDVKMTFILLNDTRPIMLDEMKEYGCDCYWIKFNNGNRMFSMLKSVPELMRLFIKIKPTIIHSHLFDDSLPALFAARLVGIKYRFITKQDTFFHWNYFRNKVKYDRFNNYNATQIIAVSEETKEFIIEKEKAPPGKVNLIHHGICPDDISLITEAQKQAMRKQFGLENKTVITTVARYIEWKGYKLIIGAAKSIVRKFPNCKFVFVGAGDQKEELLDLISKEGLSEYICMTDFIPEKDVTVLYTVSDIYLHAALNEPFGFVIAEAMMYGVPVISTNTGAARDAIKHKGNGFLIYDRTPKKITQAIMEVLEMNDYKSMGEKGEKTAREMYHFDVMWGNYIALYKRVLKFS